MAEFAPVLPAALYPHLDIAPGGMHFIHAPQCKLEPQARYPLLQWAGRTKGRFILDCFACELDGEPPNVDDIYWAADRLRNLGHQPIIIIPDVLKDYKATLDLMTQHLEGLVEYGVPMIVPHGHSLVDWMDNARQMIYEARRILGSLGIRRTLMVGVPKYLDALNAHGDEGFASYVREAAVVWLEAYYPEVAVHLLGCPTGLVEVAHVARHRNVVSVDSTSPFTYALEHGFQWDKDMLFKYAMGSNWWNLGYDDLSPVQLYGAQHNIAMWKGVLRDAAAHVRR